MIRENTSSLSSGAAEAAQQQQRQQPYRIDAGYFNYPNELLGNYSCRATPSRPHICALRPERSSIRRRRRRSEYIQQTSLHKNAHAEYE